MQKDHNEPCLNNIECNLVKGLICTNDKCSCPYGNNYNKIALKCGKNSLTLFQYAELLKF